MMDRDPYAPRRRIAGPLIALLLAFVGGIALTAFAVTRWQPVARWLHLAGPVAAGEVTTPATLPLAATAPAPVVPLAAPMPDQALAERVDALAARLDTIDRRAQQASGDATRAEGLLVAFAVRRALDRGQPLGFLEGMLRQRFGPADAQSVAMIVGTSQHPITLAALQDRLAQLTPALSAAPSDGWWQGLRREFGGLFVVRRAQTPSPLPADRLTRAAHALDSGQVDVALAEIARLPASAAAQDWIAAARRYVLARNALDRIETAALVATPAEPAVDPAATETSP